MDKTAAIERASKLLGISDKSMSAFVREKQFALFVRDNNAKTRNFSTVYERLTLDQLDTIRAQVHEEFCHFIKRPGQPLNPSPEVRYPTMKLLHSKLQKCDSLPKWSLSTTRVILLSMGFK